MNRKNRERFETLRAGLTARLRRVCHSMPQPDLDQLTARMARLYLKYEPWTALAGQHAESRDAMEA